MQQARSASPILIIGTERSGSNLLRLVLNAHPNIAIPHPPHFMRYVAPAAPAYGDLRDERNRRALTRDALTLLCAHIHPWEHPIDEDRVVAAASPTLFGVVSAIYEQYREAEGKPRWGCKSTFMVDYVAEVRAEYPRARFVWLVRDSRDVASSAKRSVFGRRAESWRNTDQPIAATSVGCYAEALTPAERTQVEMAVGPLMDRLGYPDRQACRRPGLLLADRALGARSRLARQGGIPFYPQ